MVSPGPLKPLLGWPSLPQWRRGAAIALAGLACLAVMAPFAPFLEFSPEPFTIRTLGRIGSVTDKFQPVATQIDANTQAALTDHTDPLARGRYLVMTACTECHGPKLQGLDIVKAPSLLVAAAYSQDDFAKLMRTGVGVGNRNLGLMAEVAQMRFVAFTDEEVDAVRTYLDAFVKEGGTRLP